MDFFPHFFQEVTCVKGNWRLSYDPRIIVYCGTEY